MSWNSREIDLSSVTSSTANSATMQFKFGDDTILSDGFSNNVFKKWNIITVIKEEYLNKNPNNNFDSNVSFYLNGVEISKDEAATPADSGTDEIISGGKGDLLIGDSFYSTTCIAELAVFGKAVSIKERREVEEYLSKKWKVKLD